MSSIQSIVVSQQVDQSAELMSLLSTGTTAEVTQNYNVPEQIQEMTTVPGTPIVATAGN